jgi:hypothetical protein
MPEFNPYKYEMWLAAIANPLPEHHYKSVTIPIPHLPWEALIENISNEDSTCTRFRSTSPIA